MIEKIKLINGMSPLVQLKNKLINTSIYMKRDDLLDFYFGGNKVRLYEYIIHAVINQRVEKLITFGSIHSNHVRVTAAVAAYFNLKCDIIILVDKEQENLQAEGNSLLLDFYNIDRLFCNTQDAKEYIDNHLVTQKKNGTSYFFVPGGGHLPVATMGYVDALDEILTQCKQMNITINAIFTPTGTGTTQAGLVYGKKLFEFEGDIIGITVARTIKRCEEEILNMINGLNIITKHPISFNMSDIRVLDNNKKYGVIDNEIIGAMRKLAKSDGILLDPIYNAKSFLAMEKYLLSSESNGYSNVLYINTGGSPNIFKDEVRRKVEL